jgi:hypothetical protein
MNSRARYARRILRDHRHRRWGHAALETVLREPNGRVLTEVYVYWTCPHCEAA